MLKTLACVIAMTAGTVMPASTTAPVAKAEAWQFHSGAIVYALEFPTQSPIPQHVRTQVKTYLDNSTNFDFADRRGQKIRNDDDKEITYRYYAKYEIDYASTKVKVRLEFGNYFSFAAFNGINPAESPRPKAQTETTLFFREITQNIGNPYTRFFAGHKTAGLVEYFNAAFNGGALLPDNTIHTQGGTINKIFVFASPFRRTEVTRGGIRPTGTNLVKNMDGSYEYYFHLSPFDSLDVIVFDRTANSPIWYGAAVASTAVFMISCYFILKSKQKKKLL